MRTQKAISNIAYHRPEVWRNIVNGLREAEVIGPCLWIAHKGEGGDKPHIHFVLLGGFKTYKTEGLQSLFGLDIIEGQKATVTALWRVTKSINDWVLYGIHHPKYLILKGKTREENYDWSDVCCTKGDEDTLAQIISEAKESVDELGDKTTMRLIAFAKLGYSWPQVVLSGVVPMGQFSQAQKAWDYIRHEYQDPKKGADDGSFV